MSWQKLDVIFKILSPLHIGYLPNRPGTVIAKTRYYVPGKNLWGAVAANLVPKLFQQPTPENYLEVGEWISDNLRFTYFYLSGGGENQYYPQFTTENGLQYGDLSLHEFQMRFIGSRISTKISDKGTAEDKRLHEIEFINRNDSHDGGIKPLYLKGSVFYNTNSQSRSEYQIGYKSETLSLNGIDLFETLTLGGEFNYGFGRVEKARINKKSEALNVKNGKIKISIEKDKYIRGHLKYDPSLPFMGDIEIVSGRTYPKNNSDECFVKPGKDIEQGEYYFVPGTKIMTQKELVLDPWGRLLLTN
jgi:hypothetical protein